MSSSRPARIRSASPDTLKNIYKRPTALEDIIAGIKMFSKYQIKAEYHYIVGNPYEPEKNVIETMRFAALQRENSHTLRRRGALAGHGFDSPGTHEGRKDGSMPLPISPQPH